jgi:hypothetical protein
MIGHVGDEAVKNGYLQCMDAVESLKAHAWAPCDCKAQLPRSMHRPFQRYPGAGHHPAPAFPPNPQPFPIFT